MLPLALVQVRSFEDLRRSRRFLSRKAIFMLTLSGIWLWGFGLCADAIALSL